MPSRRQLLAGVASATAAGLAGCSGSNSGGSDSVDCQSQALAHGDGDVLDGGAVGTVEDDDVRLAVPLSVDTVEEQGVAALRVYDAAEDLAFVIGVSPDDADLMANKPGVNEGQLRYEQFLGHRPLHGQYEIVAVDESEEALDSVTIQFDCFPEVED